MSMSIHIQNEYLVTTRTKGTTATVVWDGPYDTYLRSLEPVELDRLSQRIDFVLLHLSEK
jgi:hypothetical protein